MAAVRDNKAHCTCNGEVLEGIRRQTTKRFAGIFEQCRLQKQVSRSLDIGRHLGNLELDCL